MREHNIGFGSALRYADDFYFAMSCLMRGAALVAVPEAYYFYRARRGGLNDMYRLKGLREVLNVTQALLTSSEAQGDSALREDLSKHLDRARRELAYYSVVEPLKDGRFFAGVRELTRHPEALAMFVMKLPQILRARISRFAGTP